MGGDMISPSVLDNCDQFGKCIALTMKKLSPSKQSLLKVKIMEVCHKVQYGFINQNAFSDQL